MTINIVCTGKLSEKFYKDAQSEFIKRLGVYCKINVIELPEVRILDEGSRAETKAALLSEAAAIEKHIKKGVNVAMCVEGRSMSSEEFAAYIDKTANSGSSIINFIIGSSHGLSPGLKQRCDLRLSVSDMTLPHQLFRIVLLEQIYRAFKINANEKYHK